MKISFLTQAFFLFLCTQLLAVKPYFVENKGQVKGNILAYSRASNTNLLFTGTGLTFQFLKKTAGSKDFRDEPDKEQTFNLLNLLFEFEGCNKDPRIEFLNRNGAKENYLIGNEKDWVTGLDCYERLHYTSLYNNIDVVYYFNEAGLEYDLHLKPGANLSTVKMRIKGVNSIMLSPEGFLMLETPLGTLLKKIPESYQIVNGKKIKRLVRFRLLEKDLIGFECSDYVTGLPLVIDPILGISTFIGGGGHEDFNTDMQVDSLGNTYLCGQVNSLNFPTQPGSYNLWYSGGTTDGVVMKLAANGSSLIYCTYLGTSSYDGVNAIHVNKTNGELVMCGFTEGPGFPVTQGAIQSVVSGSRDNFVAKLNASGSGLIFSTLLGGPHDDRPFDILLDNLDNIYVTGYGGVSFPISHGCFQSTYYGTYDVYAYKLNSTATALLYGTYIGGTVYDRPGAIGIDSEHNVYITGTVDGSHDGGFPVTFGAYDNSYNGNVDIFVAKFDSTLSNLYYATYVGGAGVDWTLGPSSLKVNAGGEAIVVGYVGNGFPTTTGCFDNTFNGGNTDGALFKLSSNGSSLLYSTYMGSSADDQTRALQLDGAGNYWCAGWGGSNYPTTPCAYDNTYNSGPSDGFVSLFSSNGSSLIYSTFIGGNQADQIYSLEINGSDVQIAGITGSANYPVSGSAYDMSYNGGPTDYFVSQILNNTIPISISGPTIVCKGQQVSLTASGASTYTWSTGGTGPSVVVSPTATTVYTVVGTDVSSCYGTQTFTIGIGGVMPAVPGLITGPNWVCGTGTFPYSITPVQGATSYSWTLPGGWSGSSSTNSIAVGVNVGSGNIQVVAVNGCGQSPPQILPVTISTINLNITAFPNGTVCPGSTLQITASGANSYTWNTGSAATNIIVGPVTHPFYIAQVNGTSGICTATKSLTIPVWPASQVVANTTKQIVCRNETATLTASGANLYSWNTGATQSTIHPVMASTSTFVVTGTDVNGCSSSAAVVVQVNPCLGTNEHLALTSFQCFPNPLTEAITIIAGDDVLLPVELEVISADNKVVHSRMLADQATVVNLSDLASGIYFLKLIKDGRLVYSEKILKQ